MSVSSAECRVSRKENGNFFTLFGLHSVSLVFPSSLDPRHSSFPHRCNRIRQNSDNLVQQFDSFLNNLFR